MRQIVALVAVSLASPGFVHACDCAATLAQRAAKVSAADTMLCGSARAEALQAYAARAATLREQALTNGTLTYQQVIDAAYAPGAITAEVLAHKAHWRGGAMMRDFVFFADYGLRNDDTTVQPLVALQDPNLESTLVAQYESILHVIGISTAATDYAIFHEAGHALQRATLRSRGGASGRRAEGSAAVLEDQLRAGTMDPTTVRRLLYLSSQDEFEVRLQDLNRFHALLVGSTPILVPTDSVRALTALGVPIEFAETREAFALAGETLSAESFAAATAPLALHAAALSAAFEDARELALMRRFALRVAPGYWPRLLAKIIFEAPGHL